MTTREIALRCAAAMPHHLLRRNWADERRMRYMERFDFWPANPCIALPQSILDQLDACADDAARRLLLGVSR